MTQKEAQKGIGNVVGGSARDTPSLCGLSTHRVSGPIVGMFGAHPTYPTDEKIRPSTPLIQYVTRLSLFFLGITIMLMQPILNAGDLDVLNEAKFRGTFGLRVTVDDSTPQTIKDDTPEAEHRLISFFRFNLDGLSMDDGDDFDLLVARNVLDEPQLRVTVECVGESKRLYLWVNEDVGSGVFTPAAEGVPLGLSWHSIAFDWRSGDGDGSLSLKLDGETIPGISGLANTSSQIDSISWGISGDIEPGTSGSADMDSFESRRMGLPAPDCFYIVELRQVASAWPSEHTVLYPVILANNRCDISVIETEIKHSHSKSNKKFRGE